MEPSGPSSGNAAVELDWAPGRDPAYAARAAALLRGAANDLKRDDRAADVDLGLCPGRFSDYASGRLPLTWDLVERAARAWPLNERDLLPIHDDAPLGLRVMRAEESAATARIIERGGRAYYEYRDTAMSRLVSCRPEWIRMLQVVENDDADNPAVEWNRGHLLYQLTYFTGPVNFYFWQDDRPCCVALSTGDSAWIPPFEPHSFSTRSAAEPAHILALTYGSGLTGDAQRELSVLGGHTARALALPPGDHGALLRSVMTDRLVSAVELAARSGLTVGRVESLCAQRARAEWSELDRMADALGVPVRELLVPQTGTTVGVRIQRSGSGPEWAYPDPTGPAFRVRRLVEDPADPRTTAVEVEVLPGPPRAALPAAGQHQFLYPLGAEPVRIDWPHAGAWQTSDLRAGDSAYVVPGTPLSVSAERGARLLVLRVGGSITPEVSTAVGAMAEDAVSRYLAEDRRWY